MKDGKGQIFIYETQEGGPQIEVKLEEDTLWLSQALIAELFGKDFRTIANHIKNIYAEGELQEEGTTTLMPVLQQEGRRKINRAIKFYNLDVILSVGYRINSKRGTAFRQWANRVLKDYLIKGYAHNEKLLLEKQVQLDALKQAVALIAKVTNSPALSGDQAVGLLRVLSDYAYALDVLDRYDHQVLSIEATRSKGRSQPFTRPLAVSIFIPASRKKRPTSCTSSSRIILFPTAINVLQPFSLSGSWKRMVFSIMRTDPVSWQTMHSSH